MIYIDQMMREVRLDKPPSRIICLVPSITELLSDLGLDDKIVGITKFCIHPEHIFRSKTRVGGTKKVDFNKIDILQPDLIIANKEENTKEDIEQLEKKYPVWISDVSTLIDALEMIVKLGEVTGTKDASEKIVSSISEQFKKLDTANKDRTLYLIWKSPYMAAGPATFIGHLLELTGFENVLAGNERYPEINEEQMRTMNPSIVFLSSEPFPFKENHAEEIKSVLPGAKVYLADGEYFSWYGSRLTGAPEYFNSLVKQINSSRQNAAYEN